MSLFLKCPECGGSPITTEWKYEIVPYGYGKPIKKAQVSVRVPVRHCWKCQFEWTDYAAEELRDEAVREARVNKEQGG